MIQDTGDSFGPETLALESRRYGDADFDLPRIIGAEMNAQVTNKLTTVLKTNGELEPGTGCVENVVLKSSDEVLNVTKRAGLKRLVSADIRIGAIFVHRGRIVRGQGGQSQTLSEDRGPFQAISPSKTRSLLVEYPTPGLIQPEHMILMRGSDIQQLGLAAILEQDPPHPQGNSPEVFLGG